MEIQNKHLVAVTAAKKELEISLGYYEPGDYKQTEISRHIKNLKELQKEMRIFLKRKILISRKNNSA